MITYSIGCVVGQLASGIPSEDVAIAMLVDEFRYEPVVGDDELRRVAVQIVVEAPDDNCAPRPCLLDRNGRVEACVNREHRCDHCGQVLPYNPEGISERTQSDEVMKRSSLMRDLHAESNDLDHNRTKEQPMEQSTTGSLETAEPSPSPTKKSRARKTSEVPTRIYSYRCLPPITEGARVEDQYRLAAQYRNALVEIEHWLRDRIREIQLAHPTIGPALRLLEDSQAGVDDAYDDLRAAKSGTADPALEGPREQLAIAKELNAMAYDELREARRTAAGDEALLAAYVRVREDAHARRKAARGDYSGRGLRHGAYARIEDALRQAAASTKRPLSFESHDGSGSIGTQLTERVTWHRIEPGANETEPRERTRIFGMTLRELMSGADTRLRLGPPGATDAHPRPEVAACATWDEAMQLPRNLRRHAARSWIELRIGSNPDRSPIFARFPVTIHRLPPKDSVIKWAYIVRRRVGHRLEWRLQFTLESKIFERPPIAIGEGACAINLGWRRLIDDQGEVVGLRAAYVVDQNGRDREICVPDYVPSHGDRRTYPALAAIGKCDDLSHIRDQALERAQLALSSWLADRGGVPAAWQVPEPARPDGTVPRPMADRLRGYPAWRAAWKLRRFIDAWKTRRVAGDDQVFAALTAWAKDDRHLETGQSSMRDRQIAHRRETWRVIATELARRYATILVGESLLTDIDNWERPAPEDGDPADGRLQRRMARIAAPGELMAEIIKASAKTGAVVRRLTEARATRECNACGHDAPWDAAPSIVHQCASCGRTWDQDANHCRNLLARGGYASGAALGGDGSPLVDGNVVDPRRRSDSTARAVDA